MESKTREKPEQLEKFVAAIEILDAHKHLGIHWTMYHDGKRFWAYSRYKAGDNRRAIGMLISRRDAFRIAQLIEKGAA
jgi:hypothetical protein